MDYSIHKVGPRDWAVELDGASIGTAKGPSSAARILEVAVNKRLPPYWGLMVFDAGSRDESLGLEFDGNSVEDLKCERTVKALVDHAWSLFGAEQPAWAWIRHARPEAG